jgi:hypothetical protein
VKPSALVARSQLTPTQRDEMFALLDRFFEGVTRGQFERDLAAKDWAILVRRDERLAGFTTLRVASLEFEDEPITALYSGDTIVAPEAWRSPALARAWIESVNSIRAANPGRRCFWLLLSSGFRTYRFLPVFWREFFPRHDAPVPAADQRLLDHLGVIGYGVMFDRAKGLVRFPQPQRLRGPLAAIPIGREADPHVAFFLQRNPGHASGDELACLAEISEANLTAAGRRMVAAP